MSMSAIIGVFVVLAFVVALIWATRHGRSPFPPKRRTRAAGRRARITLAAVIAAVGAASLCYRLLVWHHLEQTSALFIGIPMLLAIVVVLFARPLSSSRLIVKAVAVAFVVSGVFLGEGFMCIVMASPPTRQDLTEKSEKIQALLYAGKFDEAEPLARECVGEAPEEIYFLSQLDMALNGQGKFRDADELRNRIRDLWEQKYKENWIAKGAPVSESSWARMITKSKEYYVIGTEYFVPRLLEGKKDDPLALYAFYKVIAVPKERGGPSRILQLDKSKSEKAYFLEEYAKEGIFMAASYRTNKPDIRAVVSDAVGYLDGSPR